MTASGHEPTRRELAAARDQIVAAAAGLVRARVLSPSQHDNISARLAGADLLLLTGVSSLADVTAAGLPLLRLDGRVVEGELHPSSAEIVRMHTAVYRARGDVGGIIHTHSPFATGFAVANRPLGLVSEAMVRFGIAAPIPVAAYAPRGSREAVANIVAAIGPDTRAVFLQNYGLLTFAETVEAAMYLVLIIEEAAQAALNAAVLGGATAIPAALVSPTRRRAEDPACG